jgi:para-nitrobenzyl esterase
MRIPIATAVFVTLLASATLTAQTAPPPAPAPTPAPAAPPAQAIYTTSDTDIGTLLDDPEACAIVDKHVPDFSKGEQVNMARGMTLKSIQQYAPDKFTDQVLADIDADLAKLKPKSG